MLVNGMNVNQVMQPLNQRMDILSHALILILSVIHFHHVLILALDVVPAIEDNVFAQKVSLEKIVPFLMFD